MLDKASDSFEDRSFEKANGQILKTLIDHALIAYRLPVMNMLLFRHIINEDHELLMQNFPELDNIVRLRLSVNSEDKTSPADDNVSQSV